MEPESPPIVRPDASPFPGAEGTPPPPIPTAEVILPPDPLATPAPEEGPLEYTDAEYGQLLTSQGLGEFAAHPQVLQGIRAFDRDYNIYLRDYETMLASLPPGTKGTAAPPLTGQALDQAINTLVARYFPGATATQREHARPLLETSVQRVHQLTSALSAADRVLPTVQARQDAQREAVAFQRARQEVTQMSQSQFDGAYAQAWRTWKQAADDGDVTGKQLADARMNDLMRSRYGKS